MTTSTQRRGFRPSSVTYCRRTTVAFLSFAETTELISVRKASLEICMEPAVSGRNRARTSELTAFSVAILAARSSSGPVAGEQAVIWAWQGSATANRRRA